MSVAIDLQGPEKARPYAEKAGATFTTVVDEQNLLGQLYGFKAVPNGYLIDEQGIVRYMKLGGFDIRRDETAEMIEQWIGEAINNHEADGQTNSLGDEHSQANAVFRKGLELFHAGKTDEALIEWRKGVELEPDNWIIRKQIWAVENPEKFYDGAVDFDWQKDQISRGQ